MSTAGWLAAAGGAALLVVVLWPADGTRFSLRARGTKSRRTRPPAEALVAVLAAVVVLAVGLAPGHAAAAAICAAVVAASLKVLTISRRRVIVAEGVARLSGVLANQASVAVTVSDAVAKAAPLVSGPVGKAAVAMAGDCEEVGVDVAAERFAARVPSTVAGSLAELVAVAASGGGRWTRTVEVLEAEASEAAATARLFHTRVATAMPTLAIVVLLGAGLVAGSGQVATDVGDWLADSRGAGVLAAGSAVIAVLSARVLLPSRAALRAGGSQ